MNASAQSTSRPNWGRLAAINVGGWAVLSFLFAIQGASRSGWTQPFGRVVVYSLAGFIPYMILTPPVAAMVLRFRFAPGTYLRSGLAHLAALSVFVVAAGSMMGLVDHFMWPGRARGALSTATWNAIPQYIAFHVVIYGLITTLVLLLVYARQWKERSVAAAALQGQLAEARLGVLTAQLQPHFLFNTLNAIAALVREDADRAERLLARLSELLRQALRDGLQPETPLENELSFLEKYAEVQETRFGPRLHIAFDIAPDVLDARVPPLLLQPIVENAITHGVGPRSGDGSVRVRAASENGWLHLSVTDDGVGLPLAEVKEGIGLRTTRTRLRQLYGDDHQLRLERRSGGGTICSISLPLRRASAAHSIHG